MLKQRVVSALWGIPLLVAAIWFDKPLPWFTVVTLIAGALSILEFYRLVASTRAVPLTYLGLIWTMLFIISRDKNFLALLEPNFDVSQIIPLLLTSLIVISLIWLLRHPQREMAFAGWAWTMGGVLYVGWLLSYVVALRGIDDGRNWVLLAIFAAFASDTMAFLVGRTWGRHHLAPHISPAKTWEGAVGGVFGAVIASLFFTLPTPLQLPLGYGAAILLGLLVSVFGQLGDLVESLFKRNMGVKDSGKLIPGHGGLLDRLDSVVFTGVVVYYYAVWLMR